MKRPTALAAALAAVGIGCPDAHAVRIDPDGVGQALIYPYFTVNVDDAGNMWNTYLSVVNRTAETKVARVRFREGRNAREVASFNLYLAPNDVFTGAIVASSFSPTSQGRFLTADTSCTGPRIPAAGMPFSNAAYTGPQGDGLGSGLDRTREGYVEIIEMATLTGAAALAVRHSAGVPEDCAVVEASAVPLAGQVGPPTGGLSGTLTLINVNSGMDAGMNAIALAELTSAPFYRDHGNPYPSFASAEVLPSSSVVADGKAYDLRWSSGIEAVTSVFMASELSNEYVLDAGTRSQTDWVVTFPTRPFVPLTTPPFVPETFHLVRDRYDREGTARSETAGETCSFAAAPCPPVSLRFASGAFALAHEAATTSLLGSRNPMRLGEIPPEFAAGWMRLRLADHPSDFGKLRSQPGSTMTDFATGTVATGRFEVRGLPWVGFMLRTFRNGAIACAPGICQGNYGGSFPHRYTRSINPVP